MDPITDRGRWWIPQNEKRRIDGSLHLGPEEFSLTINQQLAPPPPPPPSGQDFDTFFEWKELPVVWGRLESGSPVTLLGSRAFASVIPADEVTESWRPTAVLIGEHLAEQELEFSELYVDFTHMRHWVGNPSIFYELTREESSGQFVRMMAQTELLRHEHGSTRGATMDLVSRPSFRGGPREMSIGLETIFQIIFQNPQSWRESLNQWVLPLRALVSFCTDRRNLIGEIGLRVSTDSHQGVSRWVRLLVRTNDLSQEADDSYLIPQEMLILSSDLPMGFEMGISAWFNLWTSYREVIRVASGDDSRDVFLEDKFLSAAQAAEMFHREFVGTVHISDEDHRARVNEVLEVTPDAHKQWVRVALRYAHRFTFRQRLKHLITEAAEIGDELCGGDSPTFIDRVVKTRDYLVHLLNAEDSSLLSSAEMVWHYRALVWLLKYWILREWGLGDNLIPAIRRNLNYQKVTEEMATPRSSSSER
jgi:hypothetical protein